MKLTRNRIRKIRKQQHQSVRKWKKVRKSMRRHTFRRSPKEEKEVKPPVKVSTIFNKTLKKYIPMPVLAYLKEKYDNMRQLRRKQRRNARHEMIHMSGGENKDAKKKQEDVGMKDANKKGSGSGLNLPEVPGDIPIRSVTHELTNENESYKLLDFLVKSGLPYYIQIELKPGQGSAKKFTKRDSDIFDLLRILYGKFAPKKDLESGGKIPEEKQGMYFTAPNQVGIADGDTLGNEYPDKVFIFTKEKGQINEDSKELEGGKMYDIKLKKGAETITLTDSNRLYKLSENGDPQVIDDVQIIRSFGNHIHPSEFRIQVVPMSADDFKKAVEISAATGKPGKKVVSDDANSYIVNLSEGCKITSIQTLRKALEMVRTSLENEDDDTKTEALNVFKSLNELLEDPEFMKNDGYNDFKEKVFAYSYKIPGSERKYGFTQLSTFFEGAGTDVSKRLTDEYMKLLSLLGHGPAGENGACMAFNSPGVPLRLKTVVTPLANGDVLEQTTLENATDITGVARFLNELQGVSSVKKAGEGDAKAGEGDANAGEGDAKAGESDAKAGESEGDAKAGEGDAKAGEGDAKAGEGDAKAGEGDAKAGEARDDAKPDEIKEVDAIDSRGTRFKAYVIKRYPFPPPGQDLILVHFMGWNESSDEFIPASEESTKILPRDSKTITGSYIQLDDTIDKVKQIYTEEVMKKKAEKAKEESKELSERSPSKVNSNSNSNSAAAAAATAAAMAAASVAQSLTKKQ